MAVSPLSAVVMSLVRTCAIRVSGDIGALQQAVNSRARRRMPGPSAIQASSRSWRRSRSSSCWACSQQVSLIASPTSERAYFCAETVGRPDWLVRAS